MIKTTIRNIHILLSLLLCFILFCPAVSAAAGSQRSYNLDLTVNGDSTVVNVGDEITLQVKWNGGCWQSGSYALYAVQDEIIYDSYFPYLKAAKSLLMAMTLTCGTVQRQCIIISRLSTSHRIVTPDSLVIATFRLSPCGRQGCEIISRN